MDRQEFAMVLAKLAKENSHSEDREILQSVVVLQALAYGLVKAPGLTGELERSARHSQADHSCNK